MRPRNTAYYFRSRSDSRQFGLSCLFIPTPWRFDGEEDYCATIVLEWLPDTMRLPALSAVDSAVRYYMTHFLTYSTCVPAGIVA